MNRDTDFPRPDASPGPDPDRLLAEWLEEQAPQHEPPVLIPAVLARTALTRRRSAWLIRDWWLQLPLGRRHGATWRLQDMPYATPLIVALTTLVLGATLAITGVLTGAIRGPFDAPGPATYVVAADGSGDFTTIAAAVEAAVDGDTILVHPGQYLENVLIEGKDLTISGDGDRADIVVEGAVALSPDPERAGDGAYGWAFYLLDTESFLSNLTITGRTGDNVIEVHGEGSAPVLESLVLHFADIPPGSFEWRSPEDKTFLSVWWSDGTGGVLRGSTVERGDIYVSPGTNVTIEDNEMPTVSIHLANQGGQATIRNNVIGGGGFEFGMNVGPSVGNLTGPAGSALIEGNDISSAETGFVGDSGDRVAVILGRAEGEIVLRDNTIHDSLTGISVSEGSSALIEGNRVTGNDVGLSFTTGATAVLTGNTVCDNGLNLEVTPPGTAPPDTSGNEICPDEPPAAGG